MGILSERIKGTMIDVDIQSSNMTSASYNTETENLMITFKNGSIYEYTKVPWPVFTKFRLSQSQGKFFSEHIKSVYTFKKL